MNSRFPGVSESLPVAARYRQLGRTFPNHRFHAVDDQLRDPVPVLNDLSLIGKINEDDFYFTAVIRINRAWGIEAGNTLVNRQAAAGSDLGLKTGRQ